MDLGIDGITDAVFIDSGGTSSVYRARQASFDRVVAVKVMSTPVHDETALRRFAREASLTGRLSGHPGIARVHGAGVTQAGLPFLVMEYYRGGSIADRLKEAPIPESEAVHIGICVVGALATAHAHGVLHRDVKPANVLIDALGEPVLADFGIAGAAEATTTLTSALTLQFAAPESLEDAGHPTEASDQYSLGLLLRAMLLGGNPWASMAQRRLAALPQGTTPELAEALARATADEPSDRWPSVEALGAALQQVQRVRGDAVTPMRVLRPDPNYPPARADGPSGPDTAGWVWQTGPGTGSGPAPGTRLLDDDLTRMSAPAAATATPARRSRTRGLVIAGVIALLAVPILVVVAAMALTSGPSATESGRSTRSDPSASAETASGQPSADPSTATGEAAPTSDPPVESADLGPGLPTVTATARGTRVEFAWAPPVAAAGAQPVTRIEVSVNGGPFTQQPLVGSTSIEVGSDTRAFAAARAVDIDGKTGLAAVAEARTEFSDAPPVPVPSEAPPVPIPSPEPPVIEASDWAQQVSAQLPTDLGEAIGRPDLRLAKEEVSVLPSSTGEPAVKVRPADCRAPWLASYNAGAELGGLTRLTRVYKSGKTRIEVSVTNTPSSVSADVVASLRSFQDQCPIFDESWSGTTWLTREFFENGVTDVAGYPAVLRQYLTSEPRRDDSSGEYVVVDANGTLVRASNSSATVPISTEELLGMAEQVAASVG